MKQTDVHAIKISHVLQGKLGAPVSVAGSQLLGCLSSLENPAGDSESGAASQKPESPRALGKEFKGSKTSSPGKGEQREFSFHTLQPQGSALPNPCPLC